MKLSTRIGLAIILAVLLPVYSTSVRAASGDLFSKPLRGFVSDAPAKNWQQGILTGNGTIGAIVMGNPYDETLFLSHAGLYLPNSNSGTFVNMASRLADIRNLCLAGNYGGAAGQINAARKETSYNDARDPFIAAFTLRIKQPEGKATRYQRAVNFMSAETLVAVADERGNFRRSAFASRVDDVLVLRLVGSGKQSAEFSFAGLIPTDEKQKQAVADGVKSTEQGVKGGLLYFRTLFARTNPYNPNIGYEGAGMVIAKGGTRAETETGIRITDADEILVLVKIQPLPKTADVETNFPALLEKLNALTPDYDKLLAPHAKAQGDLMGRVSLSLNAPAADRDQSSEQLNKTSASIDAPLAKIERAFDAGRYNIICSTGFYPPNLQGIWSGTWSAPWSGSFTTNGNLPTAVAFLLMGNTPELMKAYFRYYDERWSGFRENAKAFYGTRGFHVPAQLTLSPKATDFNPGYPHCFNHAGAPWALEFYYDYYRYTGDRKFLAERAYPLMKEAAAFYEDFLTVKDASGKVVFVPDYSSENAPGGEKKVATCINATMDLAAARQLLRNAIAAAKRLGRDPDLQAKWADLIAKIPPYEVGPEGSFREWLWPGEEENNAHRHASHLYALYDERPAEIVDDAGLVKAVEHTIGERLAWRVAHRIGMAFGIVQLGLASEHVGNAELAQQNINLLAKNYWSDGMASFHDWGNLFNMDISGGFPYLCASALVYADQGSIRFFPARPPQWESGSLRGVRLRGNIVVRELTWDRASAKAILVSGEDQTLNVETPDGKLKPVTLRTGVEATLNF